MAVPPEPLPRKSQVAPSPWLQSPAPEGKPGVEEPSPPALGPTLSAQMKPVSGGFGQQTPAMRVPVELSPISQLPNEDDEGNLREVTVVAAQVAVALETAAPAATASAEDDLHI